MGDRGPVPYYSDAGVVLYLGDCREVMPRLDLSHVGVVVADPPYGVTSLPWDRWQTGWVSAVAEAVAMSCSLWSFGSMRMFIDHAEEFAGWHLAQDVVWEKHNGSNFANDRFRRVHELIVQWYRGAWAEVRHVPVTTPDATRRTSPVGGSPR